MPGAQFFKTLLGIFCSEEEVIFGKEGVDTSHRQHMARLFGSEEQHERDDKRVEEHYTMHHSPHGGMWPAVILTL